MTTDGVDETLRLVPLDEATYCDTEWLRQGFFPMSFDEQVRTFFKKLTRDIMLEYVCLNTNYLNDG